MAAPLMRHQAQPAPAQCASSAIGMLERRRQMIELQQALSEQQAVYAEKDKELEGREQALKKKDLEFQDHLCKFIRFLQDSEAKCARAERKKREELKLQASKQAEIDQLADDIERLTIRQDELRHEAEDSVKHRDYLDSCLLEGEGFHDIPAIFAKHMAITAAAADLDAKHASCTESLQRERTVLEAYMAAKMMQINDLKAAIAGIGGHIDTAPDQLDLTTARAADLTETEAAELQGLDA